MTISFHRLIRFTDLDGTIHYGDLITDSDENEDFASSKIIGRTVTILAGDDPFNLHPSSDEAQIASVLCPLPSSCIPIIYGVGLNYKRHITEASLPTPGYPVLFTKPQDALAGPYDDIPVNTKCLNMDYEGELCVIIGRDVKDFVKAKDNPLDYVLGYTIGNDVSSRYWQAAERSGGQHGMGKSFDNFAPLGPLIVGPRCPGLAETIVEEDGGIPSLMLRTKVNGELRQETSTSDLLFKLDDILEYMSLGRTIRRGTVIMTGTPSGVAAFLDPPNWLKNGDTVEISIEEIGTIRNRMVIE